MTTQLRRVRCDNKARPWYESIPADDRAAIERSVPEDCYLSLIHTNDAPPFSARLYHVAPGATVLLAHRRRWTVREAIHAAMAAGKEAA